MNTIVKALERLRQSGQGGPSAAPEIGNPPRAGSKAPGAADSPLGSPSPPARSGPPLDIDLGQLRRYGIFPPSAMEGTLRDQYRRIKRPLLANATGRGAVAVDRGNLIMVTSAIPGEGKTFTSLNLALSIAQDPDFSVTLVDGDVARAHASKLLGVQDRPGLLDLLADESLRASDLILPTSIESLFVLPAGRPHPLSEELLSSHRMERVVSALADPTPRHIILFDSPPLLATSEAVTLSSSVGQIVMVVKASSTLRQQVTAAIELLDPEKAINLVLNQLLGGAGGSEYGGYYAHYSDAER
ncbi:MAG: hypothetical protein WED00_11560 [Aquisalimonadaceae bacterium]